MLDRKYVGCFQKSKARSQKKHFHAKQIDSKRYFFFKQAVDTKQINRTSIRKLDEWAQIRFG